MRVDNLHGVFPAPKSVKAHVVNALSVEKREEDVGLIFTTVVNFSIFNYGALIAVFGQANKVVFVQESISETDRVCIDRRNLQLLGLEPGKNGKVWRILDRRRSELLLNLIRRQ